jgi:hypothetical protein
MNNVRKIITKLESWQVACIMAVVALATYFNGLANAFQNDDTFQIVHNPPVHSLGNLFLFFHSSTFWDGQKLAGIYYRPLMTTTFSVIYALFGLHTIAYHIVQLAVYIAGGFVLYLVLKHFLHKDLAFFLALIFIVHPMNTQLVYSIPTMQDVLYFFFGMLALWVLINYKTPKSLSVVAGLLFVSLLCKEAAGVFVVMAFAYLLLFDVKRWKRFAAVTFLPVVTYLVLKVSAVGVIHVQRAAPIDNTDLLGRLFTAPSIILFNFSKFIFPLKLSTGRYWVYPAFSVQHVLIPTLIDVAIIGFFIYWGIRLRNSSSKNFKPYLFFSIWTFLGLVIYTQIIRLDMTVSETWFYFAMAGLLGMIGIILSTSKKLFKSCKPINQFKPEWLLLPVLILILVFGFRSAVRGSDYRSQYVLAQHDLAVSKDDYIALNNIAQYNIDHKNYKIAQIYAKRSIGIYPVVTNYNNLGVALEQTGDYAGAVKAYSQALNYNDLGVVYENLGLILMVYSDPNTANHFFQRAFKAYPNDFKLLLYYALFEQATGNNSDAKVTIKRATHYGGVPQFIYAGILYDQPFKLQLLGQTVLI